MLDYKGYGFNFVAGRKVVHLKHEGHSKNQCGVGMLSLTVSSINGGRLCSNCAKTVKVLKVFGRKVVAFRTRWGLVLKT